MRVLYFYVAIWLLYHPSFDVMSSDPEKSQLSNLFPRSPLHDINITKLIRISRHRLAHGLYSHHFRLFMVSSTARLETTTKSLYT